VTCKEWTWEITERSRIGAAVSPALSHHLAECPQCAERWEAEAELSRGIRHVRVSAAHLRSSEDARARLVAEFGERRRGVLVRRGLIWATAALATFFLVGVWRQGKWAGQRSAPPPVAIAQVFAEDLMTDEFVPVPYAAPLAPGEYVEVVQTELTPAALARMGFVIRAASASVVPTDLMVGQDGLPRAVRVPESVGIRY
jgi:hypothetical protein